MIAQAHGIRHVSFRAHATFIGPDAVIWAEKTHQIIIRTVTGEGERRIESLLLKQSSDLMMGRFGVISSIATSKRCEIIGHTTERLSIWNGSLPVVQEATVEEDLIALIKQLIFLFFSLKYERWKKGRSPESPVWCCQTFELYFYKVKRDRTANFLYHPSLQFRKVLHLANLKIIITLKK